MSIHSQSLVQPGSYSTIRGSNNTALARCSYYAAATWFIKAPQLPVPIAVTTIPQRLNLQLYNERVGEAVGASEWACTLVFECDE